MPRFLQFWGTTIQKSSKINNFPSRARNLLIIQTMQNFTKIIHSICPTTLDKIITLKCVNFVNFVNFWKDKIPSRERWDFLYLSAAEFIRWPRDLQKMAP